MKIEVTGIFPANEVVIGRTIEWRCIRDGAIHRGTFIEHDLDREFAISPDGTTRTGQQILDEAGVTL